MLDVILKCLFLAIVWGLLSALISLGISIFMCAYTHSPFILTKVIATMLLAFVGATIIVFIMEIVHNVFHFPHP